MNSINEILTVKQAAEYLQVSTQTIIRQIKSGKLKASKVGDTWRINKADISDYLEQNANKS